MYMMTVFALFAHVLYAGDTWIAYQSRVAGSDDIWVMNLTGENRRRITPSDAQDRNPNWSADGKIIYYESNQDGAWGFYAVTLEDGKIRRISPKDAQEKYLSLSLDNRFLAGISFTEDRSGLILRDRGSGDMRFLTRFGVQGRDYMDRYPSVSPDGAWFAFDSNRTNGTRMTANEAPDMELYVQNIDGEEIKRLTFNEREDSLASWSPNGAWLLFQSVRTNHWHIRRIRPNGEDDQALTQGEHHNWSPAWAPDGESYIFVSIRDGNQELYRGTFDHKPPIRLTDTPENESAPVLWMAPSDK